MFTIGTGLSLAYLILHGVGTIPILQMEKLRFRCLPRSHRPLRHKARLQSQAKTETKALLPTSCTVGDWGPLVLRLAPLQGPVEDWAGLPPTG